MNRPDSTAPRAPEAGLIPMGTKLGAWGTVEGYRYDGERFYLMSRAGIVSVIDEHTALRALATVEPRA